MHTLANHFLGISFDVQVALPSSEEYLVMAITLADPLHREHEDMHIGELCNGIQRKI